MSELWVLVSRYDCDGLQEDYLQLYAQSFYHRYSVHHYCCDLSTLKILLFKLCKIMAYLKGY